MLKIRLQGTMDDIHWFERILESSQELTVTEFSRPFSNKGTNRFFRTYVEVIRIKEKDEENYGKDHSNLEPKRRLLQNRSSG